MAPNGKKGEMCMKKRLQIAVLCALMVILCAFTVQAKSKIAGTLYLQEGNIPNVCVNYKYKLNTDNLDHEPVTALKVSSSSMAKIKKNVLTVKKTGLFYITFKYREDGKKKTARIPVNSFKSAARVKYFDDISVKDYSSAVHLQLLSFNYNDKEILTDFALVNNTNRTVTMIKRVDFQLKAGNVQFINHWFTNVKVTAKPYSKVMVPLKFSRRNITFDLSKVNNKNFGWHADFKYSYKDE